MLIGAGNCGPGSANLRISKVAGYSPPGGCFITGHDLETGKELWRFNLTAHSDEPGGDTWNNLPDDKRDGAAIWVAGQYDPELNLTYWGTGSPSPWSTITRGTFGADSLYVDSTVALNPDTGKLAWYYQHVPHDPYDQDYAFERIIVPVTVRGERHKAVITVGKPGIFEAMDAATGKFLFAVDPGAQNDLTSVDPVTGARTTLTEPAPPGVKNCPTGMGVRSFPAGAYSPLTNRYYMRDRRLLHGKDGRHAGPLPGAGREYPEACVGYSQPRPAVVRTADDCRRSGVCGDAGPLFPCVRRSTTARYCGRVARLNDIPNAFPITYMVDGKQYIAMPAGDPGLQGNWVLNAAPELAAVRGSKSSVLWVWELP